MTKRWLISEPPDGLPILVFTFIRLKFAGRPSDGLLLWPNSHYLALITLNMCYYTDSTYKSSVEMLSWLSVLIHEIQPWRTNRQTAEPRCWGSKFTLWVQNGGKPARLLSRHKCGHLEWKEIIYFPLLEKNNKINTRKTASNLERI